MVARCVTGLLLMSILIVCTIDFTKAQRGIASRLRAVGRQIMNTNFDDLNSLDAGSQFGSFTVGAGYFAFRSGIISSLCQLDRGEKEAAMETLRVTIASLALGATQSFGLPVISVIIDKMVNKYGARFPRTVRNFASYNQMLGNSIIHQTANVAAPQMLDRATDVLDELDTLKNRMRTDFADEVTSFLQSSQAYDDLVRPLQNAKTWAKVARWTDFLLGPIFDAANIAFTGWQLHGAIQSGDDLAIASGSLGIISSVVGIASVVVGSLATAGSIIAATAGPIGVVIGCVLTVAALIIDIINTYNPTNTINAHLELVRSLTTASKDMLAGNHKELLEKATSNGINVGFNTLYEINQAMLVKASISDPWDTIRGFNSLEQRRLEFKPDIVRPDGDFLVVGEMRVFDQKHYQNWAFKPEGREEIGYSYYGKEIVEGGDGISVRLNTDLITNQETNLWFWLNGAKVTTYASGQEEAVADDNVNIGDFRTLWMSSGRKIEVNTGGGDDLIQITGIICAAEQQRRLEGQCLIARMGSGSDMISFEGMDTREEKLEWYLNNNDLSEKLKVTGIVIDFIDFWLSYRLSGRNDSNSEVRFGGISDVERFTGSPLNDVVKFGDSMNYYIKQSTGDNVYELHLPERVEGRQYFIEDNSDTPGHLKIYKNGLSWQNIVFCNSTNIILIMMGSITSEVFLKRCNPGIDKFRVSIGNGQTKELSEITNVGPNTGVLIPFVPYQYRFYKNLTAQVNHQAYVELLLPASHYPSTRVSRTIKFIHRYNKIMLSPELLDALRSNRFTLKAHRDGRADADARWSLVLHRRNSPGGWKVNIIGSASIVSGPPSAFWFICILAREERDEINIMNEYRTVMQEQFFNGRSSFTGTDEPDKLILKRPAAITERDPPDQYVIDLKGPLHPRSSYRNELVIDDGLLDGLTKNNWGHYYVFWLERESTSADWHLNIYSNWNWELRHRIDVTLKNVHAIIAGPQHQWQLILNLAASDQVFHNVNELIDNVFGRYVPTFG